MYVLWLQWENVFVAHKKKHRFPNFRKQKFTIRGQLCKNTFIYKHIFLHIFSQGKLWVLWEKNYLVEGWGRVVVVACVARRPEDGELGLKTIQRLYIYNTSKVCWMKNASHWIAFHPNRSDKNGKKKTLQLPSSLWLAGIFFAAPKVLDCVSSTEKVEFKTRAKP